MQLNKVGVTLHDYVKTLKAFLKTQQKNDKYIQEGGHLQKRRCPTEDWGKQVDKEYYRIWGELEGEKGGAGPLHQAILKDRNNKIATLTKEHKDAILMNRAEMDRWKHSYAKRTDAETNTNKKLTHLKKDTNRQRARFRNQKDDLIHRDYQT